MSTPHPLNTIGRIQAIAYAGADLQVHLVCSGFHGNPVSFTLDYPVFSRLLREKADRGKAIRLLESFRDLKPCKAAPDLRSWALINVVDVLGCELTLDNPSLSIQTPLQTVL